MILSRFARLWFALALSATAALAQAPQDGGLQLAPSTDGPLDVDKPVVKAVASVLEEKHLSARKLDDEISKRWLALYLQSLDPNKRYFLQADVDAFAQAESKLDDFARVGDLRLAYVIFKIYLKRVDEYTAAVRTLLAAKHDFNVDETTPVSGYSQDYARDVADLHDRRRRAIKYDLLKEEVEGHDASAAVETVRRRYEAYRRQIYRLSDAELMELYLGALTAAFDRNSVFYSAESLRTSKAASSANLHGIGAQLQQVDGVTQVVKILPKGPAALDGRLKAGDQILGVGAPGGAIVDVRDHRLVDIVSRIRGEPGTAVRLSVRSKGSTETQEIQLDRGDVALARAVGEVLDGKAVGGASDLKIGYLDLPSFYSSSQASGATSSLDDVRRILREFHDAEVHAVVVDLRQNEGGSVKEVVEVTGLFLPSGPVMQSVSRGEAPQTHQAYSGLRERFEAFSRGEDATRNPAFWHGPLVVLTSKTTASGAEIFASAVQDYGRGLIIGEGETFGHGLIGTLVELGSQISKAVPAPELGAVKVTTGRFFRISGNAIQNQGVTPDLILPAVAAIRRPDASLRHVLPAERGDRAEYQKLDYAIDQRLRSELERLSDERRAKDDYWKTVSADVQRRRRNIVVQEVPLKRDAFQTWYADSGAKTTIPAASATSQRQDDAFIRESIRVTLDYVSRLESARAAKSYSDSRYRNAWDQYVMSVRADPDNVAAHNDFAWMMATCPNAEFRDGKQAVQYGEWVCKRSDSKNWNEVLTLAVAYAEAGDFDKARLRLKQALDLAPAASRDDYRGLEQKFADGKSYVAP